MSLQRAVACPYVRRAALVAASVAALGLAYYIYKRNTGGSDECFENATNNPARLKKRRRHRKPRTLRPLNSSGTSSTDTDASQREKSSTRTGPGPVDPCNCPPPPPVPDPCVCPPPPCPWPVPPAPSDAAAPAPSETPKQ